MLNDTPHWVAIYTNSRAEKRTAQHLSEQGFEAYLPMLVKLHQWSDRWKHVEVPLIPSYIFVKIRAKDVVPLRNSAGVSHIISWHGTPAIIPDSEINAMKRMVDSAAEIHVKNTSQIKLGAKVRIIEGPFINMEGLLVRDCEDGNFCISISGLDFTLVTTVEKALLQPIDEESSKNNGILEKQYS